jgi:hypothetical protein
LIQLDNGRLLRDLISVPDTSGMMCCRISRQLSWGVGVGTGSAVTVTCPASAV